MIAVFARSREGHSPFSNSSTSRPERSMAGWVVAEVGRQPWIIERLMPTLAAVSDVETSSVQTTFWIFAGVFTVLLIAEIKIMIGQIKKGMTPASPEPNTPQA